MRSLLLAGAALAVCAPAHAAAVRLAATLSGAEVPHSGEKQLGGDADGSGTLMMEINTQSGYVCYSLVARNVERPAWGGIHAGVSREIGPVLLPVDVTGIGNDSCGRQDLAALTRIIADPSAFYVNVRNRQFPGGAIRGQFERK